MGKPGMDVQVRQSAWQELRTGGGLGRFTLLCLGVWLHAADSMVTATAVPAIVAEIGGVAYVGWTIALYQVGTIVAGAATGLLAGRIGVTRAMALGAGLFALGCAAAGLAPGMAALLAARVAQGVGGGLLIGLGTVAIQQGFPEHLWGRLFGIQAAIWGGGALIGPLIGGLFAAAGVWRLAFWCFAAQGALLWALLARLPAGPVRPADRTGWPLRSVAVLTAGTFLIAGAGIAGGAWLPAGLGLAGILLLLLAARLDARGPAPMLPAGTLDPRRPLGAGLLMVFCLSVGTTGFWAYGPLILATVFNVPPLTSGYIMAGGSVSWSLATMAVAGAPVAAYPRMIRWGALVVAAGAAGFTLTVPAGSLAGIVLCSLAQGAGFGLCWPAIVQRAVQTARAAEGGLAAAAVGTVQRIGYAVGAAATGIAANAAGLGEGVTVVAAQAAGFWVFAAFLPVLAVAVAGAWRFTR